MTANRNLPARLLRWMAVIAVAMGALFLGVTSSAPDVADLPEASAEQVAIGRATFHALRRSRDTGQPATLVLRQSELDAAGILLSQGFAPNRVAARAEGSRLDISLSRPLLGRWLNLGLTLEGSHRGFPELAGRVSGIPVPAPLTRLAIQAARALLNLRGADIPPLDALVPLSRVERGQVVASLRFPRTGKIRAAMRMSDNRLDPAAVAAIYCRLAAQNAADPQPLFARQLGRALTASAPTPEGHAAAMVALAMHVVKPSVGELVHGTSERIARCPSAAVTSTLQGRPDSPKHWALSAALAATSGQQLSEAMGEWKELADSLSKDRFLARRDTSGFSFVDLAADRAGFLTAKALADPSRLAATRRALLSAGDDRLLPPAALALSDGMPNREFVARYGATDDPRFAAAVREIDALLSQGGIE